MPGAQAEPAFYDVGGEHDVLGVSDDPVGLVGCMVAVPWRDGGKMEASRCIVDAYAPDAPGGGSYIISWCRNREEHHLLTVAKMAERGAHCSSDVQAKLKGASHLWSLRWSLRHHSVAVPSG